MNNTPKDDERDARAIFPRRSEGQLLDHPAALLVGPDQLRINGKLSFSAIESVQEALLEEYLEIAFLPVAQFHAAFQEAIDKKDTPAFSLEGKTISIESYQFFDFQNHYSVPHIHFLIETDLLRKCRIL